MKNNLKKIKVLFILLFALFYSCEKDLYENVIPNNIVQKHIKLKDLDIKTISKINQKITEAKKLIKKKSNDNSINKLEYNDDFGFYIDLENGRLIDNNGELSYTFPMFRESEEKLENIVFKQIENGEMEAYIAKYNIDSEEFNELSLEEKEDLAPEFFRVYFGGIQYVCSDFSYSVTTYPNCPYPNGVHPNGVSCEATTTTYVTTFCNWMDSNNGGDSTGGGSTTGNSSDTSGNYTGSSGGSGANGVSTTPIIFDLEDVQLKLFIKELTTSQNQGFLLQNNSVKNNIFNYLISNEFDTTSLNKIKNLLDVAHLNNLSLDYLIVSNGTNSQNLLNINSISDLNNHIQSLQTEYDDNACNVPTSINQNTNYSTKTISISPFNDLRIDVVSSPTPHFSLVDNSCLSYLTNFTIGHTWTQSSMNISNINYSVTNAQIRLIGYINSGVSWEGFELGLKYHKKIIFLVNKNNGQICSTSVTNN